METGEQFDLWTEATIEDSFLDPCQTMSLRVGVDETRFGLVNRLRKGGQFQLLVNGAPQPVGSSTRWPSSRATAAPASASPGATS